MIKKIHMLIYFIVAFSLFSIGYTGSYFSDIETSSSCSFTAGIWPDCIPYKPTNLNPENNAVGIDITPTLSVYVSDPDDDTMDVYFYNAANNILIDTVTNIESNTTVSVVWQGLDYGITYEWYAIAEDYEGSTQSDTWRLTTNHPPDMPSLISPANALSGVELSPTLKVQVFDPDGNSMSVSFYDALNNQPMGTNVNVADSENASITWDDLSYSHTYSWYVIVNDSMIETQSDTWSFTTIDSPPESSDGSCGGSSDDGSPPPNNPPIANTSGPYYGKVLETILFNGSNSFDPDGVIVSYYWDFDDGTNTTEINATAAHQYTDVGTYDVNLTVTDDDGAVATNTTTLTITLDILEINDVTATPNPQNTDEHVNITCTLTNTSEIVDMILNITHPDNPTTNISMVHINETDTYYYNSTYSDVGEYTFFIFAIDTCNNTATSNIYHFSIVDLQPPTIVDHTPKTAYKNHSFTFNATVTDNKIVTDVYVEYWYETENHTNVSMNNIDNNNWNKTITIPSNYDILQYIIYAKDTSNNCNHTGIKSITLLENN